MPLQNKDTQYNMLERVGKSKRGSWRRSNSYYRRYMLAFGYEQQV